MLMLTMLELNFRLNITRLQNCERDFNFSVTTYLHQIVFIHEHLFAWLTITMAMLRDMMIFASHARPEPIITPTTLKLRLCIVGRVSTIRVFGSKMCGAVHNVLVVAMFAIEITVARLTVIHSEYN